MVELPLLLACRSSEYWRTIFLKPKRLKGLGYRSVRNLSVSTLKDEPETTKRTRPWTEQTNLTLKDSPFQASVVNLVKEYITVGRTRICNTVALDLLGAADYYALFVSQ